jgi:MSHA biogenesis protein MshQ
MGAGIWVSGSMPLLAAAALGVSTNTPTYSEVGLFRLPGFWPSTAGYAAGDNTSARGIYDDTWANIDRIKTNCVVNSYSNRLVGGMYGCNFGIVANQTFGRFYPDHFDTVISAVSGVPMTPCPTGLTPTCPTTFNGFVYSGQAFTNLVTARNLAGNTTQNYAGAYARAVTLAAEDAVGSATALTGGSLSVSSAAASAFAAGTFTAASQKYTFTTTPTVPTDVYVSANEVMPGGDGVSSLRAVPASSVEGGVKVVSGRIKASNEYGSELLPLTLRVMAQYYTSTGWVFSSTDSVTQLAPTYSGLATTKTVTPASRILNLGTLSIKFGAPGAAGTVTVTPSIDTASPGNPPLTIIPGTAAFGVYKNNNNFIYRRESY